MSFSQTRLFTLLVVIVFALSTTGCKKKHLKTFAAIVAVGVAAKVIYDMIIDYRSEQTKNDNQVVNRYKKKHKELPDVPELLSYQTSIEPGAVVSPGNTISIQSSLEVVRSKYQENVEIQEKITIYDNQDNTKELKSLVKIVNQDTLKCGAFENQFTFTLPKGMPQGVYPIKTTIIVDGKEFSTKENKMQLVSTSAIRESEMHIAMSR